MIDGDIMQRSIVLGNQELHFEVVYRKRKTLEIQVIPPGKVRVVAPRGTTKRFLEDCLIKRAGWIRLKLDEVQAREDLIPKREYTSGEVFLYLGQELNLEIVSNPALEKAMVRVEDEAGSLGRIIVETPVAEKTIIKEALEQWYKEKALEIFSERINSYSKKIGKKPERIKLSNAKKRWGSCTSKGTTLLNWRIVMAPMQVVDYLVVHELSHLIHLNHSTAFWQLVAKIIPDYQEEKDWLKKNGYKILN